MLGLLLSSGASAIDGELYSDPGHQGPAPTAQKQPSRGSSCGATPNPRNQPQCCVTRSGVQAASTTTWHGKPSRAGPALWVGSSATLNHAQRAGRVAGRIW